MRGAVAGVARRYAEAAFAVAKEHGQLAYWEQRLPALEELARNEQLADFLLNPAIPLEAKGKIIERLFAGEADRHIRILLLLLLERGRWHQLTDVLLAFQHLLQQERGIIEVELITAVPLEEAERARIQAVLQEQLGRPVQLRTSVDPELVGGVILRIGDVVYDASVRTQLTELRRQLVGVAA